MTGAIDKRVHLPGSRIRAPAKKHNLSGQIKRLRMKKSVT